MENKYCLCGLIFWQADPKKIRFGIRRCNDAWLVTVTSLIDWRLSFNVIDSNPEKAVMRALKKAIKEKFIGKIPVDIWFTFLVGTIEFKYFIQIILVLQNLLGLI